MTVTRAEVEELVALVEDLPPTEQAPAAEELVRRADALGDPELRFRARLTLVEAYNYTPERHRMFAPFVYALQQYDDGPDWLTPWDRYRVLWTHKWMVTLLAEHPQVPLPQLETALEGMRRRYADAGEGMAPVLGCAFVLRSHVDGADAARQEFDAWRRAPRTGLSDCEGCEPTLRIEHLAELGRHDEARDELAAVLRGEVRCAEQPHAAIGEGLASLVELGDLDTAASLHRSAYRESRRNGSHTGSVARHLHVLARSGTLARGLDVLAEHRDAVERPATPWAGMQLAAAGARLLTEVVAAGDGDLPVRGPGRAPERAVDLLEHLREHALATARLFDERNGTRAATARVHAMLEATALPPLPLGPVGAPQGAVPRLPDLPDEPEDPTLRSDVDLAALDVVELAARARRAADVAGPGTWDRLAAHWRSRRGAELAALGPDDDRRVAVAELETFAVWSAAGPEPELARSAASLHRAAGDEAEATLVTLLEDQRAGRPVDAPAVLAAVDATGTPGQRARARARLAEEATPSEAVALRAQAAALVEGAALPEERRLAARLLALADEEGERRVDAVEAVLALLPPDEVPDVRVRVALEHAGASAAAEDVAGAHAAIDTAVTVAQRAGAAELALRAEATRARLLAATGDEPGAEAHGLAVAAAALDRSLSDVAVESRMLAIHLMATQGRDVEAVELAEATLAVEHTPAEVPSAHRRHRAAERVQLLDMAAALAAALGEGDRAVVLARESVDLATGPDGDGSLVAPALRRLAGLLEEDDAVEATGLYARALTAADAAHQHALGLVLRRERVHARLAADGLEAALADVADASAANQRLAAEALTDAEVRADLGDWDEPLEQVTLATLAARLLATVDEHDRALTALEPLASRWREVGSVADALAVEVVRGCTLLALGREDEGLALLGETAQRAQGAGWAPIAQDAAAQGATWLDEAGRPDEAEAFWLRHGPEQSPA